MSITFKSKSKSRFHRIFPYILPAITLICLAGFFIIYQQNLTGLIFFQFQDTYTIKGQLKINKTQMIEECFLNIIIAEKEKNQEGKNIIIDSINLTNDFFDKNTSDNEWYYLNLDETRIKKELVKGKYIMIATIYCDNLILDTITKDITFK